MLGLGIVSTLQRPLLSMGYLNALKNVLNC
jgi:hypothetical protein